MTTKTDTVIVYDEEGHFHFTTTSSASSFLDTTSSEKSSELLSYNYTLEYAWLYDLKYRGVLIQLIQFLRHIYTLQKSSRHSLPSNTLPNELAMIVMAHCDAKALVSLSSVSKSWKSMADAPEFWDKLCVLDFNVSVKSVLLKTKVNTKAEILGGESQAYLLTPKELYKTSYLNMRQLLRGPTNRPTNNLSTSFSFLTPIAVR